MQAHEDWKIFLKEEINKPYYKDLTQILKEEKRESKIIYPPQEEIFNALSLSPKDIKVIILGQDPYHGLNQAHGFSFSVKENIPLPPSLKNIYKEIENEFGYKMSSSNGNLIPWVKQGVFLLNSILTVRKGEPSSHKNIGWEIFTDKIISTISDNYSNKVFLLWGAFAKGKESLVKKNNHLVLSSAHPSPYSAHSGFFGNNHFVKTNQYLKEHNFTEIDWKI